MPNCACGKRASFGEPRTTRPTHCSKCKLPGWIDVVNKKCHCGKAIPIFGARAGDKPTRCASCKLPGWIDVRNAKCHCGIAIPNFGEKAGDRPTRCASCKLLGWVDVINKRCHCGESQPSFGARAGDTPTRCKSCQLPGWMNVRSKKCQCGKSQPNFGEKLGDKPTRCSKCKLPGWINVMSKKCQCGIRASFGEKLGDEPTRCASCKLPGWIDVVSKKCQCGKSQPKFGEKLGDKPTRCAACQLPGWLNVTDKRCLTEGCDTFVNNNVFCAGCDPEPGRRRKVKERRVFEALCAAGLVPTKYDKAMNDTSCGRSRPDFFYDRPDRAILVECDEFQHSPSMTNYTPECELRRMLDLHAASGGLPTIFVRFNPDHFELDGVTQKIQRKRRHESLCAEIRRAMKMPAPPPGTLSVTYLYFDEITCAGVSPTDRGILRRYVVDTYDPRFPVIRM